MIKETKLYPDTKSEMRNMGEASYVPGIKISRHSGSKMLYLD